MTSDATLVLERRPGGLRLYLGGDLQFDTDDEAVYHERLAHPALLAARSRFAGPLHVLVLGGGDGLLVRELLRHEAVASVRVIDYNPELVALARTKLSSYNQSSLTDPRVVVEVADARAAVPRAGRFHVILSDLTFPGTLADCELFTHDWFQRLREHLEPGGVLALNGLSPDQTPAAYWCVYQTLRSAGLAALRGDTGCPASLSWAMEIGASTWPPSADRPRGGADSFTTGRAEDTRCGGTAGMLRVPRHRGRAEDERASRVRRGTNAL